MSVRVWGEMDVSPGIFDTADNIHPTDPPGCSPDPHWWPRHPLYPRPIASPFRRQMLHIAVCMSAIWSWYLSVTKDTEDKQRNTFLFDWPSFQIYCSAGCAGSPKDGPHALLSLSDYWRTNNTVYGCQVNYEQFYLFQVLSGSSADFSAFSLLAELLWHDNNN